MDFVEQITAAIRATRFHSPLSYSWFGELSPRLHVSARKALTREGARTYLLHELHSHLYDNFYCPGFACPAEPEQTAQRETDGAWLVRQLSAANTGHGFSAAGWQVRAVAGANVNIGRTGLDLWTRHENCVLPAGAAVEAGTVVDLRFPKELLRASPGFYLALSDAELVDAHSQRLVRFYWNLTPDGAIAFMRHATLEMNRAALPFRIKAVNHPARYRRADAVVVYVRAQDYDRAAELMERVYPGVSRSLRNGVPAFTKPLAAGVGLAEDPGDGESFGSHRCHLLAEGLVRAYEQRRRSVRERLQIVDESFKEGGVTLAAPFLSGGTADLYTFRFPSPASIPLRRAGGSQRCGLRAALRAATRIGDRLANDAVWHGKRCNWVGAAVPGSGRAAATYRALGPELYAGTSGVSLFLAQLYAANGTPHAKRTALGGIYQALSNIESIPPGSRLGVHTGWTGIAFAAANVGVLLGKEELLQHATKLLRDAAKMETPHSESDFVSGKAGAIAALVGLRNVLVDRSLVEFAAKLGDELLESAEESDSGYSWRSLALPTRRNLTGFAHGTAGIAIALLELSEVTGDARYRNAAERAFCYERACFDARAGNWRDFRLTPGSRQRGKRPVRCATTWCHGAPGIALSRLRAYEISRAPGLKAEAITALQTTCNATDAWLQSGIDDRSLCHGLAGNAEILHYGSQVLGSDFPGGTAAAHAVACAGMADRPSDAGIESPGLMIGSAGAGYFYLRLHNLTRSSILSLSPLPIQ